MACFNPRPHQGAGATGAGLGIKYGHAFQSSPAPRRGRYAGSHMSRPWPLCFNPRPHQGAGATIFAVANGYEILVSILARTKARALLALFLACNTSRMFQSSPAPRRGRYKTSRRKVPPQIKFQSSPAPRRGRYLQPPLRAPRPPNSFNPRPHQGAGATSSRNPNEPFHHRFNPRPHQGAGATPLDPIHILYRGGFNPRPHQGAGATSSLARSGRWYGSFNPRPHQGAGATRVKWNQ